MDDPDAYKLSKALRGDNRAQLIEEFAPKFNWRSDGKDSVLDIGCAGGNVTCDLILPKLPPTFSQLVGIDICDNMVDYATKNYPIPKTSFKKLDIGADISEFKHAYGAFDHIISLFCFHLVPDQRQAIQNVYNLLGPGGNCFLHFICEYVAFDVYKETYPKWSEYMEDIDDFISPYYRRVDPASMIRKHVKNAGFSSYIVDERRKWYAYHDVQLFKRAYAPVISFFSRIPVERQEEYLDDFVMVALGVKPDPGVEVENFKAGQDVNIFVAYKTVIVFAQK
ncbi:juvenile hormone acid O-methyltransferase-like [Bradysia coprophila]|uniref:juvenile hormone acid O-methyltransferase-like n=1 Tax=Bradysia coprophila TaxID=38358 RepID=UPI00187DD252|nr:juvenile hormone acid O-methyltransferase-like [Bradysia coprophila]